MVDYDGGEVDASVQHHPQVTDSIVVGYLRIGRCVMDMR